MRHDEKAGSPPVGERLHQPRPGHPGPWRSEHVGPAVSSMLGTHLPLNRKERYYTGTVLPMLIGSDDFAHLDRFLELCGLPDVQLPLDGLSERPPVQFFTEYSFAESVISDADVQRFSDRPPERDTPDLVLVGQDWLLAVEAKVFHRPTRQALEAQMARQRVLVDYWVQTLGLPPHRASHVLLLPDALALDRDQLSVPVVTWEQALNAYGSIAPAYWVDMLRVALERYPHLASAEPSFGTNADAKITGEQIIHQWQERPLSSGWMGRSGGLEGPNLRQDLSTGQWRSRAYEVRHDPLPENPNWFPIEEFVRRANRAQRFTWHEGDLTPAASPVPAPPTRIRTAELYAANDQYLRASVTDDGSVILEGQNLSGTHEYEYAFTIAPQVVPALKTALGGSPGDDVLELLTRQAGQIYKVGESHWLHRHGIPVKFWSRQE